MRAGSKDKSGSKTEVVDCGGMVKKKKNGRMVKKKKKNGAMVKKKKNGGGGSEPGSEPGSR